MAKTDILTATETYGKAQTAFKLALANAASQREASMYNLGADFTTQGGKVLTPNEVGAALGGPGLEAGTRMTTGFGDTTLPTIQKEQTASIGEAMQANVERGIGTGSGIAQQQKIAIQDTGALETQRAVQEAQGKVAEANAEQAGAALTEQQAEATYRTVNDQVAMTNKEKAAKAAKAKKEAAAKRASARAAANQKAVAAGKPKPYGAGGAPKAAPAPSSKPTPAPKKGKK
jgi:hypothetical protein